MSRYQGTRAEVEAAQTKRNAEIRAWAQADQANADEIHGVTQIAALLGVPTAEFNDWDWPEILSADPETEPEPVSVPDEVPVVIEPEIPIVEAKKAPKSTSKGTTAPK